jgi:hypothetical protein
VNDLTFDGNLVSDNRGPRIVTIDILPGTASIQRIQKNLFRNNVATGTSGDSSAFHLSCSGTSIWAIHQNEFNNPLSTYEISTNGFSGVDPTVMIVNATNNLFPAAIPQDATSIDSRIFDNDEDASKPQVLFEPFLMSNSTIECLRDCSGQGVCIFPGYWYVHQVLT